MKIKSLFLSLVVGTSAQAAEFIHEVTGNADMRLGFMDGESYFNLGGDYQYYLGDGLQVGGRLQAENGMGSAFAITALGTYNFLQGQGLENAFFVNAGLGLVNGSVAGKGETNFKIEVGGGKRISVVKNVTWKPQVQMVQNFGGVFEFVLIPVSISVLFSM